MDALCPGNILFGHAENVEIKDLCDNDVVITTKDAESSEVKTTDNTVTVNSNEGETVNVTLDNVNINASSTGQAAVEVTGSGNTNIELNGNNTLTGDSYHAGLEHNKETDTNETSGKLTITDTNNDGKLTATGGYGGAGIGGGDGKDGQVTIVFKMIVFPFWLLTAFLALILKWTLNLSAFVLALPMLYIFGCGLYTLYCREWLQFLILLVAEFGCFVLIFSYVQNPDKTEQGELVSSYQCSPLTVDEEFLLTKRLYEQTTGRSQKSDVIAYQVRQSFKPGEVTPEEANRIGYEFAERFLKGKHAFIVATHTDRAHIHNHIVFNSTALDCLPQQCVLFVRNL